MFSPLYGSDGHPIHPPLTDAAIGAYTVAVVFAIVGALGWIEDAAGKTSWLALLTGLAAGAAAALTGLADLLRLDRETEKFRTTLIHGIVECPRFGGHLSAWSALSGWAGRMRCYAKGIELQEAVSVGVPA